MTQLVVYVCLVDLVTYKVKGTIFRSGIKFASRYTLNSGVSQGNHLGSSFEAAHTELSKISLLCSFSWILTIAMYTRTCWTMRKHHSIIAVYLTRT